MSYMNQAAFAPARGIQELSFEEIEEVVGGAVPAAFAACAASAPCAAGVAAVGTAIVSIVVAVVSSGTCSDDCTTKNTYDSNGRLVKSTTVCN